MALSNLQLRVLSGFVLAPVALGAVWAGGLLYILFILFAMFAGFYEWAGMTSPKGSPPSVWAIAFAAFASVAFLSSLPSVEWDGPFSNVEFCLSSLIVWPAWVLVYLLANGKNGKSRALWLASGIPYLAFGGMALISLRILESFSFNGFDPKNNLFYLLLVVWGTDTGAYFTGKTIGGPKIWPQISPKKTWSGLFGGMASAAIMGYLVSRYGGGKDVLIGAFFAAVLAIVSQAGDFFESFVKRRFGVKDSGTLIPGHGGLLDRVDGLLFAAIFMALYALVWG